MAYPVPFADIAKASNDLLNKDFYHVSAGALEVKSTAPNGVTFNVKGKSTHEGHSGGAIEAKYADKASGVSLTQAWTTANALDTKLELDDQITKGLKLELLTTYAPHSKNYGAKSNLYFKQANFHGRAFVDLFKGPTATVDAVLGQDGYLVGVEAGYDVQKAAITRYSAAVGYQQPTYTASITATNNLSVFSAAYYHKVNSLTEAGAKATWDSKAGNHVGLEVASKYRLDPSSFVKAKVNDRGIAAVAYSVMLRDGLTFGVGASFDTQKLNEATHKVGVDLKFSA